jgi:hypothetical protein
VGDKMTFSQNSTEGFLLEWIKTNKKPVSIYEVLKTGSGHTVEQKRRAIWRLLDDDQLDLTNDLKIIYKSTQSVAS